MTDRHVLWGVIALAVGVSLQRYWLDAFNNYRIFSHSFSVLWSHGNLYEPHPEHHDLFKYSPTFALFMGLFAWQPDLTGLTGWNLLNAVSLYAAVRAVLPRGSQAAAAMGAMALELVISMQHSQSNGLVAALVIFAFVALERERPWTAGALIAAGFFLKIYGVAVAVLALLYPWRGRVALASVVWGAVLAVAPLLVLSGGELAAQYAGWSKMSDTFVVARNASLMRLAEQASIGTAGLLAIQAIGGIVYLVPFARRQAWSDPRFRLGLLCSLLIAMVIFNKSAEPPTYIVAVAGGAIWYAARERKTALDHLVLALVLFTSVVSTEVYPWRGVAVGPYTMKTVSCFAIWLRINAALLAGHYSRREALTEAPA